MPQDGHSAALPNDPLKLHGSTEDGRFHVQNDAWEVAAQRVDLAAQIGLPEEAVTDVVLEKIAEDPVFLHRLKSCKSDPRMFKIVLSEVRESPTPQQSDIPAHELVGRATMALARWGA